MRLIDADRLVKCFCAHCTSMGEDGICCEGGECFDKKLIDTTPTVEAEQGRWIDMGDFEQCSICTGTHLKTVNTVYGKAIWIKSSYCPNCGARMVEDE